MASWSCSGMPRRIADRPHGHLGAEVGDEVERPLPTSGSRVRAQNSRTLGSMAFIFFGVNTRDMTPRCTSWRGGSSKRIAPRGISKSALMSSRIEPLPERYVSQSIRHGSTSSKRLSA